MSQNSETFNQEKLQNILKTQFPPEIEKQISIIRSQFLSELGVLYDRTIKGYEILLKSALMEMSNTIKEKDDLKKTEQKVEKIMKTKKDKKKNLK